MTPKEKAQELFDKMYNEIPDHYDDVNQAKQLALIAVDEILTISCGNWDLGNGNFNVIEYWQQVKNEINLL